MKRRRRAKLPVRFHVDDYGVFAYFPTIFWNDYKDDSNTRYHASYSHVGQHGPCSNWYARNWRPATRKEYMPLLRELRNLVGYKNLKVVTIKPNPQIPGGFAFSRKWSA